MWNNEEQEKILAVAEKYKSYFEEWDADIAIARKGPNFFYVLDTEAECFDVFSPFETAEDLETLIVGSIASGIDTYLFSGMEEKMMVFHEDMVNDVYDNYYPEASVRCLLSHMKVLAEQNATWAGLMEKTYHSLACFCSKVEEE